MHVCLETAFIFENCSTSITLELCCWPGSHRIDTTEAKEGVVTGAVVVAGEGGGGEIG